MEQAYLLSDILPKVELPIQRVQTDCLDKGIPTPFPTLNNMLSGGWHNRDLIIIASRPNAGKTAFAIDCTIHAALQCDSNILYFSLSESELSIARRMMINRIGLAFAGDSWADVEYKLNELARSGIMVCAPSSTNLEEICKEIEVAKSQQFLDMVIIDNIALLEGPQELKGNRMEAISYMARKLKACARKNGIPIIVTSMINRSSLRPKLEPSEKDIRLSEDFLDIADIIITVSQDSISLIKNAHGGCGILKVAYDGNRLKYQNASE